MRSKPFTAGRGGLFSDPAAIIAPIVLELRYKHRRLYSRSHFDGSDRFTGNSIDRTPLKELHLRIFGPSRNNQDIIGQWGHTGLPGPLTAGGPGHPAPCTRAGSSAVTNGRMAMFSIELSWSRQGSTSSSERVKTRHITFECPNSILCRFSCHRLSRKRPIFTR